MALRDDKRASEEADFLRDAGWAAASRQHLAGDASNRSYARLTGGPGGARAVLMDASPDKGEDLFPFLAVGAELQARGYSPPATIAADLASGFALIEDLGDDLFARVCASRPAVEETLYAAAVDLLAEIAATHAPSSLVWNDRHTPLAPYDDTVFRREAALAVDWWRPAVTGEITPADLREEFLDLISAATADMATDVLVLRDYHAENLIWLPARDGLRRTGLLDYQDALAGSPAYDLVSLLEDARRDTSSDLREAMIARFLERSPETEAAAFHRDYAGLGAQRNLKIIGIFARLWLRDGKEGYLALIPRVWDHLLRDLGHPSLAALRAFVLRWIPAPTPDALNTMRAAR